jgi:hypothetical protein
MWMCVGVEEVINVKHLLSLGRSTAALLISTTIGVVPPYNPRVRGWNIVRRCASTSHQARVSGLDWWGFVSKGFIMMGC